MADNKTPDLMEKIVSLCKRRGFVFQGSEIYGGLAGAWDYGHLGNELLDNIKSSWWKKFVKSRDDMYGIRAAILMSSKVWEASGHVGGFSDPLIECVKCHHRFRGDHLINNDNAIKGNGEAFVATSPDLIDSVIKERGIKCPDCGGNLSESRQFNMMFKTNIGAVEDSSSVSYLRPETAQGIFANFKNTVDAYHPKLPFGIAQIGKAFRNEITPGNFTFRSREFEQMEIEYFVREEAWKESFEMWRNTMKDWMSEIGIDNDKVHELEVASEDLAHYSKRTIDFEFDFPFGRKELFGLAYRTDFDLKAHNLHDAYMDDETNAKLTPHVIEPSLGADRAFLAVLLSAYSEDMSGDEVRPYLKLKPSIAPVICAVSPLLKNKPELQTKAREVYAMLKREFGNVMYDDNGNIGKRYRRQDEIGTPWCVVVDFETLGAEEGKEDLKDTVTIRNRDTGNQERVVIGELSGYIKSKMNA